MKGRFDMTNNDQQFVAQRIRAQYIEKEMTELDELRELDREVKRPVNIFAYVLGSLSAVIMGSGMSLVMTDIGSTLGIENAMLPGIIIGIVGLAMAAINYPIYNKLMSLRKDKYAPAILKLSEKIVNQTSEQ